MWYEEAGELNLHEEPVFTTVEGETQPRDVYQLKDPKLINQTADRYDYLLFNSQSPIISNFLSINEGKGDVPSEDNPNLEYYLLQAESQSTLIDNLVRMTDGMDQMALEIKNHVAHLEEEAAEAKRYHHKWNEVRDEKLEKMVQE